MSCQTSRANELISNLEGELRVFLTSEPKPYKIERKRRNEDREFHLIASGPALPIRFAVLVGEIIHHLRSSLDRVIWALASRNGKNLSERLQFPICDSNAGFEKSKSRGVIKDVGNEAVKIIESVQPFRQAIPRDTVLCALARASNIDKHRLLLVVGAIAQVGDTIAIGDGSSRNDISPKDVAIVGMSLSQRAIVTAEGASIFALYFDKPSPQVVANAELDVSIAFDQLGEARNVELIGGLKALHSGTAHTVELFANLFC